MLKAKRRLSASALNSQALPSALGNDNLLSVFEILLTPLSLIGSLWYLAFDFDGELMPQYLLLSVIVFALTFPGKARLMVRTTPLVMDIISNWAWIAGVLLLTAVSTGYLREFSVKVLIPWMWLAPLSELSATLLLRAAAPALIKLQGPRQRAIIVGMNAQGLALYEKLVSTPLNRIEFFGFVDSRATSRLDPLLLHKLVGQVDTLPSLVKAHDIHVIYLSLPMAAQPRILHILDALKDTTSSIYFVPDMFVTDLIQGHTSTVCGTPVISVCESPFRAFDGVVKRISDLVFSLLILALISPLMIGIALAVRLTSPGPIIFKQRRYGQDGQEILIYKFRSMTVTEDGGVVTQATRNDARITPLGALLRKTSMDELPQFINVLQGRMSIVGPRPHAVAHNELYRKLIKGYMVRHKVKPGITGWAQVNGFRGETETLEKMQGRIDYDLDYLRNWSLRLDIHIILRTLRLVAKDSTAY
jgi:putative colanic acid biosynthesis UDP-glucose lipid carrier transferase